MRSIKSLVSKKVYTFPIKKVFLNYRLPAFFEAKMVEFPRIRFYIKKVFYSS